MRARHWLAEGIILSLLAFATFAQGAAGNGTKPATSTSDGTTAAKTNATSSRTPTPELQAQTQAQKANADKAPGSSNAAPAATPVQSAGADQTNSDTSQAAASAEGEITPGQAATVNKSETLGEAARKAREEKKAAGTIKHAKVITNDDVEEGPGVSVPSSAAPAAGDTSATSSKSSLADQEKDWRSRFANARAKLQRDQEELDVDQRQLGKLRVQYYPDPSKQLSQSITNADINKQQDKIDKDRQNIQKDQDDLSTLQDDLRKSGGDPGWARL
jgi:hypothetical protein